MLKYFKKIFFRYSKEGRKEREIVLMLKCCSSKKNLTNWEDTFIKSVQGNVSLTDKQYIKLKEIYHSIDMPRLRGRTTHLAILDDAWSGENLDPRFCNKHNVSWNDVHDFDRD